MKTIFITGASSGIGFETARLFSERGWRVIAAIRKLSNAEPLKRMLGTEIVQLDLERPDEMKQTVREVLEKYNIDVLFNNAGYGIMGALERLPESEIRKLFDVDVIGTMLLTQLFIPHFKARRGGMLLTTTSLAGIVALPRDGAYGAAKRAQQSMMETLYYELKPFRVAVKCMIPGGTKTNFQTPVNDLTDYEEPARCQREYLLDGNAEFPGPQEAAEVVWGAVHDGKDQINYPTDSVCRKLYDEYINTPLEDFKLKFYEKLFMPKED